MNFLWTAAVKYAEYIGVAESDRRKVNWHDPVMGDPLPTIENWVSPTLEQYLGPNNKRKLKRIGDSPRAAHCLISARAADALRDIWDRHALLYPVKLLDDPENAYFMVVVKTVLDCLIIEESTGAKPTLIQDKRPFVTLHTWAFKSDCVSDNDLFVLPGMPYRVFVSERFKARIVAAKLKGFCLKTEFWEDKPFVS